ncbi:unnamed protein product [Prunus armeniaca]
MLFLKYKHLAEALHNHTVKLGPTVLAYLFKNLHTTTLENPLNLFAPGAFWMIQIWLQVYFPELRFSDIVLPEEQVLALPLMSTEVPKRLIEEYLMFFRHCGKRFAAQWQVVIRRTYPWFQPGYRLFEMEPEEETAQTVHKDARCAVNKINNSAYALYPSWEPNSSSTALKVLFYGWDSWVVHAGEETYRFMVQTIKDINAQIIEDPSLTKSIGGQSIQAGKVIDLELPSRDEEDEILAEQPPVEVTPSARRKRKETAPAQDSATQPEASAESPPPPTTRSRILRKRTGVESDEIEELATVPTETSETDDELRKAFEAIEQEKEKEREEEVTKGKEKKKELEEEEEIPAEVAENKTAGVLAMVTNPLKPPIVAMPIHSLPGSPTTASFADPELAEFEAMDLVAQLDKLEKLSSTPSKAKSKAVDRVKIWQSTELDLDENQEAVDQLIKDLDLLHRENMAPRPILEISLGLARDVLNLHNRYEDLKPSFKASEFCKATHEANLIDYQKQKAELDMMVVDYKETKTAADKLEKHIEELQKQLASLRGKQNRLGAGLGSKTKTTFLMQNMVSASRPALEIEEASIHQGMLLQKQISTKKTGLQETLKKLGF